MLSIRGVQVDKLKLPKHEPNKELLDMVARITIKNQLRANHAGVRKLRTIKPLKEKL